MNKKYKKKIAHTLKYSEIQDENGKFVGGGILNSITHLENEMWVDIMDDPVLDHESEEWGVTGRPQIHIAGTRKAVKELGILLLALANYYPPFPGYSTHIELNNRENKPGIHFIFHLPVDDPDVKPSFSKVYNTATGILGKDGIVRDTTLPVVKE